MKPSHTIDNRLTTAATALHSALGDETLLAALGVYGYDQARLEEGLALLTAARSAQRRQEERYGARAAAAAAWCAAQEQAYATYTRHRKVARVALREHEAQAQQLDLLGARKRTVAGQLEQAGRFYEHALNDEGALGALARYGITPEKLQADQATVEAARAALVVRERCKGEAQAATQQRHAAFRALDQWLSGFLQIARVALEENPQQLEKLGIVVR